MRHAFLTFALGLTLCGVTMTSGDDYLAPETLAFALRTASPSLIDRDHLSANDIASIRYPTAETLSYSDPQGNQIGQGENQSEVEIQSELFDLYTEQIMDMQRAIDLLSLQLQLGDELIDSQSKQIQGLQNSLESVKRLSDARVAAEKARCPQ